jgi:hypothetical protein
MNFPAVKRVEVENKKLKIGRDFKHLKVFKLFIGVFFDRNETSCLSTTEIQHLNVMNRPKTTDYRCADGRLQLSARGVTILDSLSVSSSETGSKRDIKKLRSTLTIIS